MPEPSDIPFGDHYRRSAEPAIAEPVGGTVEGGDVGVVPHRVAHGLATTSPAETPAQTAQGKVAGQDGGGVVAAGSRSVAVGPE